MRQKRLPGVPREDLYFRMVDYQGVNRTQALIGPDPRGVGRAGSAIEYLDGVGAPLRPTKHAEFTKVMHVALDLPVVDEAKVVAI